MKINSTILDDVYLISTDIQADNRGFFSRLFCMSEINAVTQFGNIKQINTSFSKQKGTIRSMHDQLPRYSENKIARCIKDAVYDDVIDVRKDASNYQKWLAEILRDEEDNVEHDPRRFANGVQA